MSSDDSSSDDDSSSRDEEEFSNVRLTKRAKLTANDATEGSTLATIPAKLELVQKTSARGQLIQKKTPKIIVLLDQATVETVKNRRGIYELLNCDDHRELCKKKLKKDPNEFRPDILHQEMLALLDSPLNKAGLLQVYVKTKKNVLIEISPATRIPRTYKRFAGLMVQLLHKMKIKAGNESTTLLKVIKNPFSQHLPAGTRCYGFSSQGTLYSPIALAKSILTLDPDSSTAPTCFVLGAMATGHITIEDHPYIEEMLSISEYPLSGAAALSRIMGGVEHHWGIV